MATGDISLLVDTPPGAPAPGTVLVVAGDATFSASTPGALSAGELLALIIDARQVTTHITARQSVATVVAAASQTRMALTADAKTRTVISC